MKAIIKLLIVSALASCTEIPATTEQTTRAHRESSTDTATAVSGISFDLSDTILQEDEETLHFTAEEWGEVEQDAEI